MLLCSLTIRVVLLWVWMANEVAVVPLVHISCCMNAHNGDGNAM